MITETRYGSRCEFNEPCDLSWVDGWCRNCELEIEAMRKKPRFCLTVRGSGAYDADRLTSLFWEVFKHRLHHLWTDRKWVD